MKPNLILCQGNFYYLVNHYRNLKNNLMLILFYISEINFFKILFLKYIKLFNSWFWGPRPSKPWNSDNDSTKLTCGKRGTGKKSTPVSHRVPIMEQENKVRFSWCPHSALDQFGYSIIRNCTSSKY